MNVKDSLKPTTSPRVIDLVAAAGVDVSPWAVSKNGPVKVPASNPAYCYEWAYIEPGKLVLLNLWWHDIQETDGKVDTDTNLKDWAAQLRDSSRLTPEKRRAGVRRALRMDEAIAYAHKHHLPLRVIVGEGLPRDLADPNSPESSRMDLRFLDPEPWSVERYQTISGAARIARGAFPKYVDQFDADLLTEPLRRIVTGEVTVRDPRVRAEVLRRSEGRCEFCGKPGFQTVDGQTYLETHHVLPLSEGGPDVVRNVAALCPDDHRKAHYGEERDTMRSRLQALLEEHYRR